MGAYGAMRYAFRHPDVFSVVYGMHPVGAGSGIVPTFSRPIWALMQSAKTLGEIAKQEAGNLRKLRGIRFDWGRYDATYAHVHGNRELTRELDEVLPFFARRLAFD